MSIYTRFMQNKRLDLSELSNEFKVSDRTIKRDIQEIRNYLYDNEEWMEKKNIYFNYNSYKYSIQEQKKPSNK
ncbi:HTH domain-containing protein [Staphylococcus coagulans]|uniref:HTH domain-containing protein n=1 Tax=Staphylococcus coagulans TaxID=74706 RepID=UPI0022A94876|nr:HTH domain-containing protein [Staphylococcus coagulans]